MSKLERITEAITLQKKEYLESWTLDAQNYRKYEDYNWMASFLSGHKTIVEIGTGDGSSTLSLVENRHVVIGIDENYECLKGTYDMLKSAGHPVKLLKRGQVKTKLDGYTIEYKNLNASIPESGALLIEGDITNDDYLIQWLIKNKPFDGIVCWLIGSHATRSFNIAVKAETPGDYRFEVQNQVYEVADKILRKDGILNIVDRMPKYSFNKEEILASHQDQATVTSLNVTQVEYRDQPHFKMGEESMRLGLSGISPLNDIKDLSPILISISSVKP